MFYFTGVYPVWGTLLVKCHENQPMNSPILRLSQVSLAASVGVDYLLRDISFTVNEGEKIAIIGASGSGKTSLLRLLNRLSSPVEGEIYFLEKPYQAHNIITLRQQIMLVPQEPKLLGMTGKDALTYPLQLQQLPSTEISDRLSQWCDTLQIPQAWLERNELQLSLGQRQLITIARALMLEPKILLLDEPTSALDRGASDRLLAVLNQLNISRQTTILMVNHQLEIVQKISDRILYLNSGKILKDVKSSPENWHQVNQLLIQENQTLAQEW
ncbi:Cobalt ABC transporter [Hyella patelloides LEGE 07179]|uniref:Cobalt ABC transporter n=1 Tax=Hyella patelloides LEGE 07179 TaxID=945734 RepID=A0A563VQS3_9CYAN|nr:ATP-binding cassette domain-containing protein [Hyella patelloides]VEP13816.1 Cobalt ABC transporter [Hyella patelloides LEGE 07179]